jgi:transcriptional regulator with XRE-family HTH domain
MSAKKLGEAIRSARREQGFSQEAFAAHVGLDRSYFGAVERGEFNITLATLLKVAAGLGMPASTLLRRAQL